MGKFVLDFNTGQMLQREEYDIAKEKRSQTYKADRSTKPSSDVINKLIQKNTKPTKTETKKSTGRLVKTETKKSILDNIRANFSKAKQPDTSTAKAHKKPAGGMERVASTLNRLTKETKTGQWLDRFSDAGASALLLGQRPRESAPAEGFGQKSADVLGSIAGSLTTLPGMGMSVFGAASQPANLARTAVAAKTANRLLPAAASGAARFGTLNAIQQMGIDDMTPEQRAKSFGGAVVGGAIGETAFELITPHIANVLAKAKDKGTTAVQIQWNKLTGKNKLTVQDVERAIQPVAGKSPQDFIKAGYEEYRPGLWRKFDPKTGALLDQQYEVVYFPRGGEVVSELKYRLYKTGQLPNLQFTQPQPAPTPAPTPTPTAQAPVSAQAPAPSWQGLPMSVFKPEMAKPQLSVPVHPAMPTPATPASIGAIAPQVTPAPVAEVKPAIPKAEQPIPTEVKPTAEAKKKVAIVELANRLEANVTDLAADYKARGMDKYKAWDQFIIDKGLTPGIDAKKFYEVYESVGPRRLDVTKEIDFTPTHVLTETFGGKPKQVMVTKETDTYVEFVTDYGGTGSTLKKFIKTLQPISTKPTELVKPVAETSTVVKPAPQPKYTEADIQAFSKDVQKRGFSDIEEARLAIDTKAKSYEKWESDNRFLLDDVEGNPREIYDKLAKKIAGISPKEQEELKMDLQMFADDKKDKLRKQMFAIANKLKLTKEQRLEMARGIAKDPELKSTKDLTAKQLKETIQFMNKHRAELSKVPIEKRKPVNESKAKQEYKNAEHGARKAGVEILRTEAMGYEVAKASDIYKTLGQKVPEGFIDYPIGYYWGDDKMFIPKDTDIKNLSEKDRARVAREPNMLDYVRPIYRTLPEGLTAETVTGKRQSDKFSNKYAVMLDELTSGLNKKDLHTISAMLEGIKPMEGKLGKTAQAIKDKFFDPLFEEAVKAGVLKPEQYVSNYFSRISEKMEGITGESFKAPQRWFTKSRTGQMGEYKKDVRDVGLTYINALSKAMYIDPVQKKWQSVIDTMNPKQRAKAVEFFNIAAGRPGTEENLVNRLVKDIFKIIGKDVEGRQAQEVSRFATSLIVQKCMGLNVGSVLKNHTQKMLAIADVASKGNPLRGFGYATKAVQMLATKEGQSFVDKYCTLLDQRVYYEGIQKISAYESKLNKMLDASSKFTMAGFVSADLNNVKMSFLIGYQAALKDGKSVGEAIRYADDVALRTQFPYDIRRSPAYNGPLGRLAGLFTSWPQHFLELTGDWATSDQKWRALLATAGLYGAVALYRKLGLVIRGNVSDVIEGHLLWKAGKGESGVVRSTVKDFNKFADKVISGDTESWLEGLQDAYYVLGPGTVELKRIAKVKEAWKNGWRVYDKNGKLEYRFEVGDTPWEKAIYERTGIPGEAWRSLLGQTVESEERWKEKEQPGTFEKGKKRVMEALQRR